MSVISVAVIGAGYWGMNHVRVFDDMPNVEMRVVCDKREERLANVRARFPDVQVDKDLANVLGRTDVDAVVVCTPAASHAAVVGQCLTAGKHVLVEKPMTTTVQDGVALVDLAAKTGLTLMVGHTFLFNAGINKMKECISDGAAGQIYYLYARRTNLGPIREDVNALWDLGPHDVSIFDYLLDASPDWVSAVGASVLGNGREDVVFVNIGYPKGIIGHVHLSWADPHKVREVVVVASDKRIVFDDTSNTERVRIFEKGIKPIPSSVPGYGEHQLLVRNGDIVTPYIPVSEPLRNQAERFVRAIETGVNDYSNAETGLQVVRTMEAVSRSIELNGAPVQL